MKIANEKKLALLFTMIFLLFSPAVLSASQDFLYEPASKIPGWINPAPYQRNIYWDFSSDPESVAPDYYGTADNTLKASDDVDLTGFVSWNSGKIGIDNSAGTDYASGTAAFNLGNLSGQNPNKYFYIEFGMSGDIGLGGTGGSAYFLDLPLGYTKNPNAGGWIFADYSKNDNDGTFHGDYGFYYLINPNPPWEKLIINMVTNPGGILWFDYVHIATDCSTPVPEPSTILLLGLGLIGIAGLRKKMG